VSTSESAIASPEVRAPARFADPDEARAAVAAFDLRRLPPAFYANPYPTYHALRDCAPVHRLPGGGIFLSRHADCVAVYKDSGLFSSDKQREFRPKYGDSLLYEHHTTSLVFNDPPLHTRVRKIIAGALTPRAIADMEQPVTALVDGLLDAIAARGGTADLIADLAAAVPIEVVGNLLAVPRDERAPLRGWSLAILGALEPVLTDAQRRAGEEAVAGFLDYLRILVADRRACPGDPERDVLTRLIRGEEGTQLSERELLHNIIFILNAGHETTTNLIGNALVSLTEWPDQKARLIQNPGLINSAVEEFLRFESSNQLGNRMATAATKIGGVPIEAGTFITIGIGAANRDPAEFPDPDRLDLSRTPNRHLAFGSGPHVCAGLNVARLEGRIAIARFLARFPDYRLADTPTRGGRVRFRGFLSIPVVLGG
jgi:cytochrome P450